MEKLVACIMGQNCEKFIKMCLESVKEADAFYYLDGGSSDNTLNIVQDFISKNTHRIAQIDIRKYDQEDKQMNGKQRNFYLDYLKKNHLGKWCLVLDADEVIEDFNKIKKFIQTAQKGLWSIKMRHFHNDLGHEDATKNEHYVLNRLFYINSADKYQEVEHPMLLPKEKVNCEFTNVTTIWHLAHINHCFNIKGRYEKNLKHSNIHTKEFLDRWYRQHLFGQYPNKQINLLDIPEIILKEFHIDKDEFYFANRGIEIHHPIMVKQWDNYFKPDSVLDLGCGRGPYLYFWRWFVKNSFGLELSEFAKNNAFIDGIKLGNINNEKNYFKTDLIIAFDVLEHLTDDNLDKTLKNMVKFGNKFLISVPVIENPNLEADKTHIQKKTMQEWIKLIESYGIILEPTPKDWLFWPQIIIGRKR